ncbi:uncharacterized protein LOC143430196 [Xylocopa sonorina]|uniref:uncharacterized protein LOC143430196 n=1 Tax=Xylocopa sonorina TaxID=1818115 RepID=UPI00403B37DD
MPLISQRRRHPCWRMLVLVVLSALVRHCEPMSTKRLTDSSSPVSSATLESRSQKLGTPSDLAWQAWLLLDSQTGAHSSLDSATFLRRITPKSVFIAPKLPVLPPCADGYRADSRGRCIKNVNIDHVAQLDFILQGLNNRYANRGSFEASASTNNQRKSSGPLQLNIPLRSDTESNSPNPISTPPSDSDDASNANETSSSIPEVENNSTSISVSGEDDGIVENANGTDIETSASNESVKKSSGPLQLNIPLGSDTEYNSPNLNETSGNDDYSNTNQSNFVISVSNSDQKEFGSTLQLNILLLPDTVLKSSNSTNASSASDDRSNTNT